MDSSPQRRGDQPHQLGDVLTQLFALRGYGRSQTGRQLQEVWGQVAGETIARQTSVQGIKNGSLHICVTNSAMLQELESFHKWPLLDRLTSEHGDLRIRDLKFRLRSARTR